MNEPTRAARIPVVALPTIEVTSVLQQYDGPLLVTASVGGEPCIMRWADQDDKTTRWVVARTSDEDVRDLRTRKLSLLQLLSRPGDDLLVIDLSGDSMGSGGVLAAWALRPGDLDPDYLPESNSFLIAELEAPVNEQ